MKKILLVGALVAGLASTPAMAQHHHHGGGNANWVGPLIGGVIIGGIISESQRPRYYPAPPVVVVQPPVYVNPNPYGVQPNPYLYQYPPQCRLENVYDGAGQYLGRQQICN